MEKRIYLGKKDFLWYLKMIPATIVWGLVFANPNRISWDELCGSMISHNCEFDYDTIKTSTIIDRSYKHHKCKHYGCNMITYKDKKGNWLNKI